jgi:hypothetical protein
MQLSWHVFGLLLVRLFALFLCVTPISHVLTGTFFLNIHVAGVGWE